MSPDFARVKARLERYLTLLDLSRDDFGKDLCKAGTDGCQACIAAEKAPDGSTWPDLSTIYEEWKAFNRPGNPMGVLDGIMANPREVAGDVAPPTPERAEVTYGVTEEARQHAAWFQVRRPFWGFTPDSIEAIRKIVTQRLSTI